MHRHDIPLPPVSAACSRTGLRWLPSLGLGPVLAVLLAGAIGCAERPVTVSKKTDQGHGDKKHDHSDDHDDDHDDHDHEHPTTFAGAVAAIEKTLASLEKAFADGAHDKADTLVHEAGHLLEDGDGLIAKIPESVMEKARKAWDELGDALGDLDEKLHDVKDEGDKEGKEAVKKAYDGLKDRLRSTLESLKSHAKAADR